MKSICIILPVHNAQGTLHELLREAVEIVSDVTADFEIVVVNRRSTDDTAEEAEEVARYYPQVRVVHLEQPSDLVREAVSTDAEHVIFLGNETNLLHDLREQCRELLPAPAASEDSVGNWLSSALICRRRRSNFSRRTTLSMN